MRSTATEAGNLALQAEVLKGEGNGWRQLFHPLAHYETAQPLRFAIGSFLQLDAATAVGGLAGHDKTWVLLSTAKALLKGKGAKLWGEFEVLETVPRVVYLIPESSLAPFAPRLRLLGLYPFLKDDRLLTRTLSMGARPLLSDPRILVAAKSSFVMLDTLARFTDGDENSAGDFQVVANDILALMGAGALGVAVAHHAPKSFARETSMSLEGVLRGTGDVGAIFSTVWAVKQIDRRRNLLHVECVKARDFDAPGPFELVARPNIDDDGDLAMLKRPGECGSLADEQPEMNRGGAPIESRQQRVRRIEMARGWLNDSPSLTVEQLRWRFEQAGISMSRSAAKNYRRKALVDD